MKAGPVSVLLAATLVTGTVSAASAAAAPLQRPQIVGGSDVAIADVPWQVLFIIGGTNVCAGSLVSPTQVVSAAHCFAGFGPADISSWAGITNVSDRSEATRQAVTKVDVHPGYDANSFANDIAVVTLGKPVSPDLGTATITLPVKVNAAEWPAAGATATVSGWGETDPAQTVASDRLQAAAVTILASPQAQQCGDYGASYLPSMQVCAGALEGGVDACQGDSGGGLTSLVDGRPLLAGIASTGAGCAAAGFPGLYVRTTSYLSWLGSVGVDVNKAGVETVSAPGGKKDGEPANFAVGQTYPKSTFATLARMPARSSRLRVTGGKACKQVGQSVTLTRAGKCTITIKSRKSAKSVSIVVTVY